MAERSLIQRFTAQLRSRSPRLLIGPGDDAAVVRVGGGVAVTSTDTTVIGVHLPDDPAHATPAVVGHRALATALSDLAAMGVPAGESYLAITVPPGWGDDAVLELVAAVEALSAVTGNTAAGGDVTSGPVGVATVTVVGWAVDADHVLRRDRAAVGQRVGVTGALGGSRAGRAVLQDRTAAAAVPDAAVRAALVERYLRPLPRFDAGLALVDAGVAVAIDLSDGVAVDAAHVGRASNVVLEIDVERLPVQDGVAAVFGADAPRVAATGGEDFELLFTADEDRVAAVEAAIGDVTWIGRVGPRDSSGAGLRLRRGGEVVAWDGFEHLFGSVSLPPDA
ncbi:MAG: thiamine-phosphate kinase [Patulibacter sp.]|nr:thiamine-phosphate kinase [Patulibacter sp.]